MRHNRKDNLSNKNCNNIYKKLEKSESSVKPQLKNKIENSLNNLFLYIFLVLSICLTITLYLFYRFNSDISSEIAYVNDVHKLKAFIKNSLFLEENNNKMKLDSKKISKISGFIEINEIFEGISIIGKINGLIPGSTHGVHILEYSDVLNNIEDEKTKKIGENIFSVKNLNGIKLNHFNPLNLKHSCPSINEDENYHFGDLGNIIANNEGKAFISIIKKMSLKSINGRLIVISNSPDKCQEKSESDSLADVIAFGQLGVYKPTILEKTSASQEYFLREINTVNKKEFDVNNNLNKKNLDGNKEKKNDENLTKNDKIFTNKIDKVNRKKENSNNKNFSLEEKYKEIPNISNEMKFDNKFDNNYDDKKSKETKKDKLPLLFNQNNYKGKTDNFDTSNSLVSKNLPIKNVVHSQMLTEKKIDTNNRYPFSKDKDNKNKDYEIMKDFESIVGENKSNEELKHKIKNDDRNIFNDNNISPFFDLNPPVFEKPKNSINSFAFNKKDSDNKKMELSEEDILNNLLNDLNKNIKEEKEKNKEEFNLSTESNQSKFVNNKSKKNDIVIPGTEGITFVPIDNNDNNLFNGPIILDDSKKNQKEINFFDIAKDDSFSNKKNESKDKKDNFIKEKKSDPEIRLEKLFENIVKDEEKSQQKKINSNLKKESSIKDTLFMPIPPSQNDFDTNFNQNSMKLEKEFKKIPISLAQIENEKETKKGKKKINHTSNKSDDFSFISTNLEPFVNKIVTNSTAKSFLNNVDLNLIDPYKIADMDDDNKETNIKILKENKDLKTIRKSDHNQIEKSVFSQMSEEEEKIVKDFTEEIKMNNILNSKTKMDNSFNYEMNSENSKNKTNLGNKSDLEYNLKNPEDIYKINLDSIQNFQEIIKNKTIDELEKLPDSPIDLPLKNQENKNVKNSKKFIEKIPIIKIKKQIANKKAKEKNTLLSDVNKKENFRFLNKLTDNDHFSWLKFKQHNTDNEKKNELLLKKNISEIIKNEDYNNSTNEETLIERKIKSYYSDNKNYFEKLHQNLTNLDKKVLGLNYAYNKENKTQKKNKLLPFNPPLATTFIQNVKDNMVSHIDKIEKSFSKDNFDLKETLNKSKDEFENLDIKLIKPISNMDKFFGNDKLKTINLKKNEDKNEKSIIHIDDYGESSPNKNKFNDDENLDYSLDKELDDFFENNSIPIKNTRKNKKAKKKLNGKMEKFFNGFESNNLYSNKINSVDKNKLFYNHFKDTIPLIDNKFKKE